MTVKNSTNRTILLFPDLIAWIEKLLEKLMKENILLKVLNLKTLIYLMRNK